MDASFKVKKQKTFRHRHLRLAEGSWNKLGETGISSENRDVRS
jgi:hypothetical protein